MKQPDSSGAYNLFFSYFAHTTFEKKENSLWLARSFTSSCSSLNDSRILCSYSTHTKLIVRVSEWNKDLANIWRHTLSILSSVQQKCEFATVLALSTMDIAQAAPDCFGFPDCSRSYQIAPDCTKLYIPTCSESCDMLPSCTMLYQLASDSTRFHRFAPNRIKLHHTALDSIGKHQIAPDCTKIVPKCTKSQSVPNPIKLYVSICTKLY